MDEGKQEHLESSTYVAVVAPVWLQSALVVFLRSAPALKLVACTVTVDILLGLDLAQTPELIILQTDKSYRQAQKQIERIRAVWPASSVIAIIPHHSLEPFMHAAGANEVLVSGVAPNQLRLAISRLTNPSETDPTDPVGDSKP